MKVSINKSETTIPRQGNIVEFEFEDKTIIGIYMGLGPTGHSVVILSHPTLVSGIDAVYSRMNNVRLFEGTVTISND